MQNFYKPLAERIPDYQYQNNLVTILNDGVWAKGLLQGQDALTCFGTLAPMAFDLQNGVPLITERALPSWKSAVAELIAFINGARTIDEIESYGVNKAFWSPYRGKGYGPDGNDMGEGSYGAAFCAFPAPIYGPDCRLNQFQQLLQQLEDYPNLRTHLVTPWIPYYTARGTNRRVIVAPCHGWLHFRVLGEKLHMRMDQRSADMPIGVPHNLIQYAALLLMVCQVSGYEPGNYAHSLADAHIYKNQVEQVKKLVERAPRPFPTLHLDPGVKNLFDFRIEHFELREYDPHPGMKVPYAP